MTFKNPDANGDSKEIKEFEDRLLDMHLDDCAECPKCMQVVQRVDLVNLLKCDRCQIYFCFNCIRVLGTLEDGEDYVKKHYEVAYCRYIDAEDKVAKKKADAAQKELLGGLENLNHLAAEIGDEADIDA